jgi:zinc transport system substrate-binding protein
MNKLLPPLLACLFAWLPLPALAADHVVASIKPLHSLVAMVMGDTGTPALLVSGNQSPHGYALKPSQVDMLHKARLVFYIDARFETFMNRALENLPEGVKAMPATSAPGLKFLAMREGGVWGTHDGHHEGHVHMQGGLDMHVWLSPVNAMLMTRAIATALAEAYPEHKSAYEKNADATIEMLQKLDRELRDGLAPYQNTPYIVFHDAFHYFENAYGLTAAGSISLEPDQLPGAKRIDAVRDVIKSRNVKCVFSEPQFDTRLVKTVLENTDARLGVIDEHGAEIEPGQELYASLLRSIAAGFKACLQ